MEEYVVIHRDKAGNEISRSEKADYLAAKKVYDECEAESNARIELEEENAKLDKPKKLPQPTGCQAHYRHSLAKAAA